MATTYIAIGSTTLTATVGTVTFSGIPQTFTDLLLRASTRSSNASTLDLKFTLNGVTTGTLYSSTVFDQFGGAARSVRHSSRNQFEQQNDAQNASATANTFGNFELYIPNYTVSANKPASVMNVSEDNATGFVGSGSGQAAIAASAHLFRSTTAITSLSIISPDMVAGSSFHLYGIKNS